MSNFYFPEDLLSNVLSRLPVKTLLRFKRVSKSWRGLIHSRYFTKMHSNRLENNGFDSKLVMFGNRRLSDGTSRLDAIIYGEIPIKKLQCPPLRYKKDNGVELLGSSNGVLCLQYAYRKIVLWNPLFQNYWELPRPRVSKASYLSSKRCYAYGFGYDKTTDDYKVVSLAAFFDIDGSVVSFDGWTYSLKLKRWKKLEIFSYTLALWQNGILVKGALHWISSNGLILAFNLADEKFNTVPQPNYPYDILGLNVGVLGGCLTLTCKPRASHVFRTWVMRDYGMKDSWTRTNLKLPHGQAYRPVVCSDKHIMIQDGLNKLIIYDREKQSVEKVSLHRNVQIHWYLETLECYDESERNSCKHKRTRGRKSDDTSTFVDQKSEHPRKRIKL